MNIIKLFPIFAGNNIFLAHVSYFYEQLLYKNL